MFFSCNLASSQPGSFRRLGNWLSTQHDHTVGLSCPSSTKPRPQIKLLLVCEKVTFPLRYMQHLTHRDQPLRDSRSNGAPRGSLCLNMSRGAPLASSVARGRNHQDCTWTPLKWNMLTSRNGIAAHAGMRFRHFAEDSEVRIIAHRTTDFEISIHVENIPCVIMFGQQVLLRQCRWTRALCSSGHDIIEFPVAELLIWLRIPAPDARIKAGPLIFWAAESTGIVVIRLSKCLMIQGSRRWNPKRQEGSHCGSTSKINKQYLANRQSQHPQFRENKTVPRCGRSQELSADGDPN